MFWMWFFAFLFLILGIINTIWPHKIVNITWAVRHGIDEKGKESLETSLRLSGFLFIILSFMFFSNI